ncbi:hypothetical protein M406DRAFT_69457 [Cryphonectria parasitica EP155]|uniref:Uncharacterized protein n=1 Tax=Cryphonectria parasitica (strain ATCC 38755 / EP155) TaxID=660469 RepID=A0A9P5CR95_CRYP1|nr:uncharacterized protein M406DRAFT_69457 [Cryphonectria parasitica EP155]KAF3767297.1 hypothetical protein M406DRAFT_69457 [Cryphonectria parasitica EP155]
MSKYIIICFGNRKRQIALPPTYKDLVKEARKQFPNMSSVYSIVVIYQAMDAGPGTGWVELADSAYHNLYEGAVLFFNVQHPITKEYILPLPDDGSNSTPNRQDFPTEPTNQGRGFAGVTSNHPIGTWEGNNEVRQGPRPLAFKDDESIRYSTVNQPGDGAAWGSGWGFASERFRRSAKLIPNLEDCKEAVGRGIETSNRYSYEQSAEYENKEKLNAAWNGADDLGAKPVVFKVEDSPRERGTFAWQHQHQEACVSTCTHPCGCVLCQQKQKGDIASPVHRVVCPKTEPRNVSKATPIAGGHTRWGRPGEVQVEPPWEQANSPVWPFTHPVIPTRTSHSPTYNIMAPLIENNTNNAFVFGNEKDDGRPVGWGTYVSHRMANTPVQLPACSWGAQVLGDPVNLVATPDHASQPLAGTSHQTPRPFDRTIMYPSPGMPSSENPLLWSGDSNIRSVGQLPGCHWDNERTSGGASYTRFGRRATSPKPASSRLDPAKSTTGSPRKSRAKAQAASAWARTTKGGLHMGGKTAVDDTLSSKQANPNNQSNAATMRHMGAKNAAFDNNKKIHGNGWSHSSGNDDDNSSSFWYAPNQNITQCGWSKGVSAGVGKASKGKANNYGENQKRKDGAHSMLNSVANAWGPNTRVTNTKTDEWE